ncbi:DUF4129 domain-containing protein [Pseudomonas sp. 5P_3.1_Bac2]|uniref:DUF4129 domain-containing protein n=1 Tax=Pseudomonas sp. 5P_3.1_Bac2 TaxID=2971617 RepID=UPI0021CA9C45|nr:DUF4129 domain-containing protein [Pseudomonas sp. 5P_3.1_Bac2]MCU1715708.1 DUF4129 domain-containing protein [Pseudomonas sp. 5P_3.1_Bac2]
MRLSEASVVIRPRTPWEAIDLGMLLAKQHAGLLMLSWAIITLPLFGLLCLLLWDYPSVVVLLFWWLKPAFERLPLYILSNALFGATPSLKQALKAWPGLLKPQLIASLTWRRFSLSRSFALPIQQLEGLSGDARQQRFFNLIDRSSRTDRWLTIVGSHMEYVLYFGLLGLFYLMLPVQFETNWQWEKLFDDSSPEWFWLEHLSNALYVLVLIVWEPIYVACGFTLYLNRRTSLEAWDLELKLRQLGQRLKGVATVLALSLGLLLVQAPAPLMADDSKALLAQDANGPKAPRLLKQELSSEQARQSINQLLNQPPFENKQSVTRWRFVDEPAKSKDEEESDSGADFFNGLLNLHKWLNAINGLTLVLEVLLWSSLFGLIGWLLWRYREWLKTFVGRVQRSTKAERQKPEQLFGLQVSPQSLPDDVLAEVRRLWSEQPREALGLLYRALLSRLLHEQHLPLSSAHTESEVLQLVSTLNQAPLSHFTQQLTHAWQNIAYGHRPPPAELQEPLCQAWQQLDSPGVAP